MRPLSAAAVFLAVAWTASVFPQSPDAPQAAPAVTEAISVVSLNTAMESDPARILADISSSPRLKNADVFLFQEVVNPAGRTSTAEAVAQTLGYHVAFSAAAPGIYNQGLAILSRYPISGVTIQRLKENDVWFHTRKRFAMSLNVSTPVGDVRLWNVHLDNRINRGARLEQLIPVVEDAKQYPGARLIGGDFNTNDFYWVWHLVPFPRPGSHVSAVRSTMEKFGFETPFEDGLVTHPTVGRHLDWIFVDQMAPLASGAEHVAFSDHRAVWATFRMGEPDSLAKEAGQSSASSALQ